MEYDSLLRKEDELEKDAHLRAKKRNNFGLGIVVVAVIVVAGVKSQVGSSPTFSTSSDLNADLEMLDFNAGTRDHEYTPGTSYGFIREGRFVEPQRESTISMVTKRTTGISHCSWASSSRSGGGVYDEIKGVTPAHLWNPSGEGGDTDILLTFPSPGVYSFKSTCAFEDGVEFTVTDDITSFYVRRELRELTDFERNSFLDAFIVLANVDDAHGLARYGNHYSSLFNFEHIHLNAAGDRHLDHIHDGMGLATQHIAMSAEFELALQSVNPALTVPYWDYTVDSVMIETVWGKADISSIFQDSELFTPEWFGRSYTYNGTYENVVTEGRFAYQQIPMSQNFTKKSPYGYLRAPWNINPSPYVTRYHKICDVDPYRLSLAKFSDFTDLMWPTCEVHFKYTNTDEYSNWYDWVWGIGYLPHGPVHSWIGGVGGDCGGWSSFEKNFDISDLEVHYLKSTAFANLKNAWRDYYIEFPSYCAPDAGYTDCMWKCMKNLTDDFEIDINITMKNPYYTQVVETMMCDTAFWPGDHLEAGSPVEASFWPIHPTIDRLLQYKSLVKPFTNMSWDSHNFTCIYTSTNCDGHNQNDLTFWKSTTYNSSSNQYEKQHLSNVEVRAASMSASLEGGYELPYIYSNFNWSHCEKVGVKFKSVTR